MAPVAVPMRNMSLLQKSLGDAGAVADVSRFAVSVIESLRANGSCNSAHLGALVDGRLERPMQALADYAHFLTILHGQVPSLLEIASSHEKHTTALWLRTAAAAFDEDRRWMARLSVVTGGALDLAGLSTAEQLVRDQREAMLTLANSSRTGCALGAAVALVIDWQILRTELPKAALLAGIESRDRQAADWPADKIGAVLADSGADASLRRALAFGATQLASLHGQLFDLLEARHATRLS